jgi:hypothetical protein
MRRFLCRFVQNERLFFFFSDSVAVIILLFLYRFEGRADAILNIGSVSFTRDYKALLQKIELYHRRLLAFTNF